MNQFVLLASTLFAIFLFGLLAIGFLVYRRIVHHAKNVERSLKFVPLLIRLPPQEANEATNRDVREMIKENIAKAEGVFNLLSGITTSKAQIYGRRHISLEIIAEGSMIYFYIAVPASLLSSVQKALASGYPGIQIEKAEDINFFSQVSKIAGVQGGELDLKRDSILPINTFRNSDNDALGGILSSLSNLGDDEGAAIQILIRPVSQRWVRRAHRKARAYLTGKKTGGAKAFAVVGDTMRAAGGGNGGDKNPTENYQVTDIEKKRSEIIEEKVRTPAFETNIRLIASSNEPAKSKLILQDMLLGFAQMTQQDANRFEFHPADSPQKAATDFIFRFFNERFLHLHKMVLNATELATIFHLPSEIIEISTPLQRKGVKEVAIPTGLPEEGLVLGTNVFRGVEETVHLSDNDRRRHLYILGQTGTGKSTLLENLMLQDAAAGKGFAFIDPHGDAAEKLLAMLPPARAEDVIYFSPGHHSLFQLHKLRQ